MSVLLMDMMTAVCSGFNASYFVGYGIARGLRPARRVGAAALAVMNAAVFAESVVLLLERESGGLWCAPGISPGEPLWLAVRALLLAGTAFVTLLVLRQRVRR